MTSILGSSALSANDQSPNENFLFCSSFAADAWHQSEKPVAYEWWYFDAVSDDGRDAIVIIFLDNFVFSPRYNAFCDAETRRRVSAAKNSRAAQTVSAAPAFPLSQKSPALAFTYYRDGKPIYRAINEFEPDDFSAETKTPRCKIGANEFHFEPTPYGARYLLKINANLRGGKKLTAALEWLAVESDFAPLSGNANFEDKHFWNLVSPRSDVTGKVEIFDRALNQTEQIQFRGTGYHDHNLDSRWLPATVAEWQWGRAHFADATAVFYRYCEIGKRENAVTKLFLVNEDKFSSNEASFAPSKPHRNLFGIKYPQKLDFSTPKDYSLTVSQTKLIDASFFYLRFLSEMRLDLGDGKMRETVGITEHLAPRSLRWRSLDWLINMRIGRKGRGAFLP